MQTNVIRNTDWSSSNLHLDKLNESENAHITNNHKLDQVPTVVVQCGTFFNEK
jgi:hypothetical protein